MRVTKKEVIEHLKKYLKLLILNSILILTFHYIFNVPLIWSALITLGIDISITIISELFFGRISRKALKEWKKMNDLLDELSVNFTLEEIKFMLRINDILIHKYNTSMFTHIGSDEYILLFPTELEVSNKDGNIIEPPVDIKLLEKKIHKLTFYDVKLIWEIFLLVKQLQFKDKLINYGKE